MVTLPVIQFFLIGWLLVQVPLCANFYSTFLGPLYQKSPEVSGVFVGFHGFLEVVIASNLGDPVGVVGGLGEASKPSLDIC